MGINILAGLFSVSSLISTIGLALPQPIVKSASNKVIEFSETEGSLTVPLYFGTPPQNHHRSPTFVVDTTFSDILVSTNECGSDCKYPVYNMEESYSCVKKNNEHVFTPSTLIDEFTALVVVDQVCIVYSNTCAKEVEFYADTTGWKFFNILGVAPVAEETPPNLVSMLYEQGVIDLPMITLNYNPNDNKTTPVPSTITFGSIELSENIEGDMYHHKLKSRTKSAYSNLILALNATNLTYGSDQVLSSGSFEVMVSSTLENFMQLGKHRMDVW